MSFAIGLSAGGGEFVLGSLASVNLNTTNDQQFTLSDGNKLISRIVVVAATGTTATAVGGIYTGAVKTGTQIVANSQVYSALTATKSLNLTIANDYVTATTVYFSLTTPEGAASLCDIYVIGTIV